MKEQSEPLETLTEIRSMMERSTRFISLNGLSGVFAGVFALVGALAAYIYLGAGSYNRFYYDNAVLADGSPNVSFYLFIFADAFIVLFASIAVATSLSMRKAAKLGVKIWDHSAKRLLVNMLIPLFVGGLFCIILLYHGLTGLAAPTTLIFYGLALVNASKYTLNDIRYLGITQIIIGLLSAIWIGYGLFFWALGFGVVHIIYGTVMYFKYEK
jgi:hypothetical protein